MNESFVNIKVDREERPDLDQIYQNAAQLLGLQGGWPLTMFLTPDQKPFYGGTYFPPADRPGLPAFPRILQSVAQAYRMNIGGVEETARQVLEGLEYGDRVVTSANFLIDSQSQLNGGASALYGGAMEFKEEK